MVTEYVTCPLDDIRAGVRWVTQLQDQGQTVEVSYAHQEPEWRDEPGPGDAYRRTVDHSGAENFYARRADVPPARWAALHASRERLWVYDQRADAERYSEVTHRHDLVIQVVRDSEGRVIYLDATGRSMSESDAVAELVHGGIGAVRSAR